MKRQGITDFAYEEKRDLSTDWADLRERPARVLDNNDKTTIIYIRNLQPKDSMATNEKVSIGRVKRDVSDLVNRVAYGGERIILTSRGKPKAALVSIDDLERLRRVEDAAQRLLADAGSLEELVAAIRRLPADEDSYEPPRSSLAAALAAQPDDPEFNLASWKAGWGQIEAEMRRDEAEDAARDMMP